MRKPPFNGPATVFAGSVICVLLLGFIDHITGYELGFFVFYFIPVAVSGWMLGFPSACVISTFSAAVWLGADQLSAHQYSNISYAFWNTSIRLLAFLTIAYSVSRIHRLLIQERKISQELRKTLDHVKTLSGLIPICANCKKIRDDKGYWQQVEEYLSKRTDAQFSHGLCQQCAEKLLKEAGLDGGHAQQPSKPEHR